MKFPKQYSDLQEWAIAHFRFTAGYIPKIASQFDDMPTFSVFHNWWICQDAYSWKAYRNVLKHAQLWLKCDEPLCFRCADMLELFIQPNRQSVQIVFVPHSASENCCFCGKECEDDIPF